jgi:hypothetical protein
MSKEGSCGSLSFWEPNRGGTFNLRFEQTLVPKKLMRPHLDEAAAGINCPVALTAYASNEVMVERRIARRPGSRFVLSMVLLFIVLVILLFTIRKHASTQPNTNPPPHRPLHP